MIKDDGMPKFIQQRTHWQQLRQKLDDFSYIAGAIDIKSTVSDAVYKQLNEQFTQLRAQPWSPHTLLDAILADWPQQQPLRDCSLAASCQRLITRCQYILDEAPKGASYAQTKA